MRDRKRRVELLSFYDHTGIENHLAGMARKGWMISRMSNYFWTYRRIEPRELHFSVCYFARASGFDPGPSEAQQRMIDLCAQTGWQLACTWFQMQVFYHEGSGPTPIHTEPALEVEAIHRACRANYLRAFGVLAVLSLVGCLLFLSSLIGDTLRLLADPGAFTGGALCALLAVHSLTELAAYFTWLRRARRAAQRGVFLATPSTAGLQRLALALLALCVACWLVNLVFGQRPALAWLSLAVLLCLGAARAAAGAVKELLKRRKVSSGVNRALTAAVSFLAALVLLRGALFAGASLLAREGGALAAYARPPLRVEELQQTPPSGLVTSVSENSSLLLSCLKVEQRRGDGATELAYEVYGVRTPPLRAFCREQLKRLILLSVSGRGTLMPVDAAPWGADEAWRLVLGDGAPTDVYLLCRGDVLARVEFALEPTDAQKALAGARLDGRGGFAPLSAV